MARPSKSEVEARIRQAVVETVVMNGTSAASVGQIAKAARVSAGTIYLHYSSKEDMLQSVYLQTKTEFHTMMTASRSEASSAEMLKRMWFDMFSFVEDRPFDFQFIEDAGMTAMLTGYQKDAVARMGVEISQLVQSAIDDQTLAPIPVEVAITLLIGPALLLAKRQANTAQRVSRDVIQVTFDRVWLAVTPRA